MAASGGKGNSPETKVISKDAGQDSSLVDLEQASSKTEITEPDITEDDLTEFSSEQKIPYKRFQTVNEQKKALEAKIAEIESRQNQTLQSTIAQYEARLQAQVPKEDFGIVYEEDQVDHKTKELETKIAKLTSKLEEVSSNYTKTQTESSLEKLQGKYPEADSMAVLGWAKVVPNSDLEELMEKSHRENVARGERAIRSLIEKKKAKARSVVPRSNFSVSLKEEDRPKSLKDSARLLKEYLNNN